VKALSFRVTQMAFEPDGRSRHVIRNWLILLGDEGTLRAEVRQSTVFAGHHANPPYAKDKDEDYLRYLLILNGDHFWFKRYKSELAPPVDISSPYILLCALHRLLLHGQRLRPVLPILCEHSAAGATVIFAKAEKGSLFSLAAPEACSLSVPPCHPPRSWKVERDRNSSGRRRGSGLPWQAGLADEAATGGLARSAKANGHDSERGFSSSESDAGLWHAARQARELLLLRHPHAAAPACAACCENLHAVAGQTAAPHGGRLGREPFYPPGV
jgi:hypothetical protein